MKKLLLLGINTRSMLNSAIKLNFEIYSTSYFSTSDTPKVKNQTIMLKEDDGESCGYFEENFSSTNILKMSEDYLDEVDYIIPVSGVSPSEFPKKYRNKILGNRNVETVEDKFKFFKKIRNEFQTPTTFHLNDIDEAIEIKKNNPQTKYIVKPLKGSGGYNTNIVNNNMNFEEYDGDIIMQEFIEGINLSSSILSSKDEVKNIINSRLLTMHDFGNENNFIYVGNILPLSDKSIMSKTKNISKINKEMISTSENLGDKFNLIGSNGIDYIYNENGLYVIEINPRIQGTFECVEKSLEINMLEAHIKACMGEIIGIPKPKYYSYKKIIYSPCTMKYTQMNLDNIYDLPHIGSITEKSEPLLTIIDKDKSFKKLYEKVEISSQKVKNMAIKHQQDVK